MRAREGAKSWPGMGVLHCGTTIPEGNKSLDIRWEWVYDGDVTGEVTRRKMMTQSTQELVRAFKAGGGKVVTIPPGTCGDLVYKSPFKRDRAHSRKMKEIRQERLDAVMRGKERGKAGCTPRAAVDVFMKFRNEKGI